MVKKAGKFVDEILKNYFYFTLSEKNEVVFALAKAAAMTLQCCGGYHCIAKQLNIDSTSKSIQI